MRLDKPRRHPVGWLRIVWGRRLRRWRILKTDCKWPARRGEAAARGSFVIRGLLWSALQKSQESAILLPYYRNAKRGEVMSIGKLILTVSAVVALGAAAATLPANTCIVSGSLDGPTPSSSFTVAMSGGLDSYWRDFGAAVAGSFSPHECRGIMIIVR